MRRAARATAVSAAQCVPGVHGERFRVDGLRQLYFLLGGLLSKLVYLPYGLAVILGFIGVTLVVHAPRNTLPFGNDGQPVPVPEIGIAVSLSVIVGVLAVTTVASLLKVRCSPATAPVAVPQAVDV